MDNDRTPQRTPLYNRHLELGGRIINFGGWAMPVQYTAVIDEHQATRHNAGLFDTCHMGEIAVAGPQALELLQGVMSRDLDGMAIGQIRLSVLTTEEGGIIDDLTVYRLGEEAYMVVTNATARDRDLQWLQEKRAQRGLLDVEITDLSDKTGKLDLQGPRAEEILQFLVPDALCNLKFYRAMDTTLVGLPVLVSRSGYTGEDGFEIYADMRMIEAVWDKLLEVGAPCGLKPAGLGARDTLRLEAGMMLLGHEMNESINPFEIIYGWLVDPHKTFVGSAALREKKASPSRKLAGFEVIGRGIARQGYPVLKDGQPIGEVTSGTYSPTLDRAIGLAFIPPDLTVEGTPLDIQVRQNAVQAKVVKLPFYKRGGGR